MCPRSWLKDVKLLADQANEAAEKFVKIFYDSFDKKSSVASKLYDEKAQLVWDGNTVSGKDGIVKFHETLPSSFHTVDSIDTQPVAAFVTGGQSMIIVTVSGSVRFSKQKLKNFTQVFLLMAAQTGIWKIVSDTYRLREWETVAHKFCDPFYDAVSLTVVLERVESLSR